MLKVAKIDPVSPFYPTLCMKREIENNAHATFWGANKMQYWRCASGVCIARFGKFIAVLFTPFYPTLWMKKATLQWENPQEVRKTSL